MDEYDQLVDDLAKHGWQHFTQMKSYVQRKPIIMKRAKEVILEDVNGKQYIDWNSGNFLIGLGHGNEHVIGAIRRQLDEMQNTSAMYSNPLAIELAKKLSKVLPNGCQRPFIVNAGSEAVESAMKMAKQYYRNMGKGTKYMFIARYLGYHGMTMGALAATGLPARNKFHPMTPGFIHVFPPYCYRCPYGHNKSPDECCLEPVRHIEKVIELEGGADNIAGVIGEPVMTAGGILVPPKDYWPMVKEVCEKNDMLLIDDEIVTGFGRTGRWFACQHWNVEPDIMTVGKTLSGGYLPISAACAKPEITEAFWGEDDDHVEFVHGHSWGQQCQLSCSAASACLDVLEREKLPEKAARTGEHMMKRLKEFEKIPMVGDVRGIGLIAAVELVKDKNSKKRILPSEKVGLRIEQMCQERGVLAWCRWGYPGSEYLASCPPLITTTEQVDQALDTVGDVLQEVSKTVVS